MKRIGPGQVAVPSHLFKVVLAVHGQTMSMYAAIVPNSPIPATPLSAFFTTVDEVERRADLDFFDALNDDEEQQLESRLLRPR